MLLWTPFHAFKWMVKKITPNFWDILFLFQKEKRWSSELKQPEKNETVREAEHKANVDVQKRKTSFHPVKIQSIIIIYYLYDLAP